MNETEVFIPLQEKPEMPKRYGMTAKTYQSTRLGKLGTQDVKNDEAKTTTTAAGQLRSRGYNVTADKLNQAVLKGFVDPSQAPNNRHPSWTPERIEQAAKYFESIEDFTTETAFYRDMELTMDEVYQALKQAFDAAIDDFGSAAFEVLKTRPDADQFSVTFCPAYGKRKATVAFDLLPEVRTAIAKTAK